MVENMTNPQGKTTRFDLTSFLAGRTTAWGIFEDRFGRLRRRFTVEMNGEWREHVFYLDETFVFDTGEHETRTWRVMPTTDGQFTATCADCIGEATGACNVDRIQMTYKFRLQLNKRSLVVDFDDRIYRMGDGIAINRATMRKWGVRLGELSLFFQRHDAAVSANAPRAAA